MRILLGLLALTLIFWCPLFLTTYFTNLIPENSFMYHWVNDVFLPESYNLSLWEYFFYFN